MNKLAIFVAVMIVTGAFAQTNPTDCLVHDGATTGTKCLVCASGKKVDAAGACVNGETNCAFVAGMTSGAIPGWCDICSGANVPTPDGKCVATPTTAMTTGQNSTCGFGVADGTAWSCLGCKAGAAYVTIDKTNGCATTGTAPTAPVVLWGTTWKACGPNQNSDAGNTACSAATPAYTGLEQSSSGKLYWTTSTTQVIKIATDNSTWVSTAGYDANCWFTNNADVCVKCKPMTTPKWESTGTATPKTLKVTCSAYSLATDASGSGSGMICRAWYMNGTNNTCAQCANKANALTAVPANGSCDWAAASTANNATKTSSIVGFSAILLLVVSRLF